MVGGFQSQTVAGEPQRGLSALGSNLDDLKNQLGAIEDRLYQVVSALYGNAPRADSSAKVAPIADSLDAKIMELRRAINSIHDRVNELEMGRH